MKKANGWNYITSINYRRMTVMVLALVILYHVGRAQSESFMGNRVGMNQLMQAFNRITFEDDLNSAIEGSDYLFDDWHEGFIYGTLEAEGIPATINYNVTEQSLAIKFEGKLAKIHASQLCYFTIQNSDLHNTKIVNPFCYLQMSRSDLDLIELVIEGNYTLGVLTTSKTLRPSYNEALVSGNRNVEIIQIQKYCLIYKDKFVILPKSRRKLKKILKEHFDSSIVTSLEKRNLKSRDDYIAWIQSINR